MKPYYEQDGITIYHGDSRDVELTEGSFDVLASDPPYGMAWKGKSDAYGASVAADGVRQGVRTVRSVLAHHRKAMMDDAHLYVFCHWQSWPDFYDAVGTYARVRNALIWKKGTAGMGNFAEEWSKDYEVVLYATMGRKAFTDGSRKGSVIEGFPPVSHRRRTHPTEKPVALMAYMLGRSATEGGCVLDPFMGSGATLLAARSLGVRAVGIELEEAHCESAAKRLQQSSLNFEEASA